MKSSSPSELVLTRAQVRSVDRIAIEEYGLPGVVLMENAGRGCAELLRRQLPSGRVVICCGRGNNGGDGFVIARHLENAGINILVLLFTPPDSISGDAAINLGVLVKSNTPLVVVALPQDNDWLKQELDRADWIVDALLGTGTTGPIREPYLSAINLINAAGKPVLAVDLPSGLDCDTGQTLGPCIRAEMTATFVAIKPGFQFSGSIPWLGKIHVIDIGVPIGLLTSVLERQQSR